MQIQQSLLVFPWIISLFMAHVCPICHLGLPHTTALLLLNNKHVWYLQILNHVLQIYCMHKRNLVLASSWSHCCCPITAEIRGQRRVSVWKYRDCPGAEERCKAIIRSKSRCQTKWLSSAGSVCADIDWRVRVYHLGTGGADPLALSQAPSGCNWILLLLLLLFCL